MKHKTQTPTKVENLKAVTPHNKALQDIGKLMLLESVTVGREFCKFMITLSISAIPIYLALLKLVINEKYILIFSQGMLIVIPPVAYLASSIIFMLGYYPNVGNFSLDLPGEIENERLKIISRRKKQSIWGICIFIFATIGMLVCLIFLLIIAS